MSLIAPQTLLKIADNPEEFAQLFLETYGTDALDDFIDQIREVWSKEGSHK